VGTINGGRSGIKKKDVGAGTKLDRDGSKLDRDGSKLDRDGTKLDFFC
jgi:hypothetical protein